MSRRRALCLGPLIEAATSCVFVAIFGSKALTVAVAGKPFADVATYAAAGAILVPFAIAGALRYHEEVQALRRAREAPPGNGSRS